MPVIGDQRTALRPGFWATTHSRRLDAVVDVTLNDGSARIRKSRQGRPKGLRVKNGESPGGAKEKLGLDRCVLSSLAGLVLYSRQNPAMNRWAFRASLRDVDSRHADENRFQAEPTFGPRMRGRTAQVPSLSKHHSQIDSLRARKRMDGDRGDRFRLREPVRGRLCIGLCRGLDALRGDILPRSPRNFALLAEGPLDEIHKLQVGGSQRREIRRTRFPRP